MSRTSLSSDPNRTRLLVAAAALALSIIVAASTSAIPGDRPPVGVIDVFTMSGGGAAMNQERSLRLELTVGEPLVDRVNGPEHELNLGFWNVITVMPPVRPLVPGDLNGDGHVNVLDLLILLGSWGPCPPPEDGNCPADLNNSSAVDVQDLLLLLANWG